MTSATGRALLVLHAPGDTSGGGAWGAAFAHAGCDGPILAPDLPGHGEAPVPRGGNYDLCDPVIAVLPLLAGLPTPPLVVGVGTNGWSAHLLALGGRASALVVVDGLGAPFVDPTTALSAERARLRALADDAEALAAPPAGAWDPRLRHGPRPHGSRRLAQRAAEATPVPTLVVETPESPTTPADLADLAARYPAGARVIEAPAPDPVTVARAVVAWSGR